MALEAAAPLGNRVGDTAELAGDLVVGRLVRRGTAEDKAGAEGEALRGGVGVDQAAEVEELIRGEDEAGGFAGHRAHSLRQETTARTVASQGRAGAHRVQARKCTRVFMLIRPNCETHH
jgi:hypothetical protein